MNPEKTRIHELEFLELCTRIYSIHNNPNDIALFLNAIAPFISFNSRIIYELSREIFDIKYAPNKEEKIMLLKEKGYNNSDIAHLFNKTRANIGQWQRKDMVLFPRCTQEQQKELTNFMEQYNHCFAPDMRNLI